MKRLALATAAGGAAYALHRLGPKVHEMHAHCREMVRTHCAGASTSCRSDQSATCR